MERFLRRLSASPYANRFVLKGALMFTAWRVASTRPTRDIDLLGRIDNRVETITAAIREVCQTVVEPDGLVFEPAGVAGQKIKEDAEYHGVRVTFRGTLQNARIAMQIDVGFGDVMTPGSQRTEFPSLLRYDPTILIRLHEGNGRRRKIRGDGQTRHPQQPDERSLRLGAARQTVSVRRAATDSGRSRDLCQPSNARRRESDCTF